eukprot:4229573-Prymnesium_polylepis.1
MRATFLQEVRRASAIVGLYLVVAPRVAVRDAPSLSAAAVSCGRRRRGGRASGRLVDPPGGAFRDGLEPGRVDAAQRNGACRHLAPWAASRANPPGATIHHGGCLPNDSSHPREGCGGAALP